MEFKCPEHFAGNGIKGSRLRIAIVLGLVLAIGSASSPSPLGGERSKNRTRKNHRNTSSIVHTLDSELLPALLKQRSYEPGPHFKGLVISIVPSKTSHGYEYYPYDYLKTSNENDTWWPASTVKLFAAIAALEKARRLGFSPSAELTFFYDDGPQTSSLQNLVEHAITFSHNKHFDRLVEFVGFDTLNREFLSKKNGLGRSVMLRSYTHRWSYEDSGLGSNRHSPKITIKEGDDKNETLDAHTGTGTYQCRDQGNCTSLRDLSEAMRRIMMHGQLPKSERFFLGRRELALLRKAMSQDRPKGHGGVVEGLKKAFGQRPIEFFHKGGYAYDWFSDNIFIKATDTGQQWLVSLANYPGRGALDEAALHVGSLLAEGAFARHRKQLALKRESSTEKSLYQCIHAIK